MVMKDKRLLVTVAFALGVGVGGIAFGQLDGAAGPSDSADSSATVEPTQPRDGAADAAAPPLAVASSPPAVDEAAVEESEPVAGTEPAVTEATVLSADPMTRDEQLAMLLSGWSAMQDRVEQLTQRVAELEWRAAALPPEGETGTTDADRPPPLSVDTPEDHRAALVIAGVDEALAEDIVWRESELAMARLDLQDRAQREGWFRTDAYYEELRALGSQQLDLRAEVGDTVYDRYLYETGQPNRVQVSSVFAGSQGEQAGILPGDVIESYAGERVYRFDDLRNATTAGERDELVPLTVRRDEGQFEVWIPRGPIGVRLESGSAPPDG